MNITKTDVFSPANLVSTVGLGLTVVGAANINSLGGVITMVSGRALDIADGFVARRTHVSAFGAAVDGTFDKLGVAIMLVQGLRHEIAPAWLLIAVAVFNSVNVVATVYSHRAGLQPKSSKHGKHAMFAQNVGIGGFALAHVLGGPTIIEALSVLVMLLSLPIAIQASYGYVTIALSARQQDRRK